MTPGGPRHRRFDSCEQEVFLNLWRTYDRLQALEEELFDRHDLTAQQYNALRVLKAAHPAGVPTLALSARLVSRAPDITRLVDKLERRGLVTRGRRADNRRVVDVAITEAGQALLRQLAGPVRDCGRRQIGHLTAEQQRTLIELLRAARSPHEPPDGAWGT